MKSTPTLTEQDCAVIADALDALLQHHPQRLALAPAVAALAAKIQQAVTTDDAEPAAGPKLVEDAA